MNINYDWTKAKEEKDIKTPVPGGYVAEITAVEDVEEKKYLFVEFDIVEGEYKHAASEAYKEWGRWPNWATKYVSYKSQAAIDYGMSPFIGAVQASNTGYAFNNDEATLQRKYVGVVLGEEEYIGNDEKKHTSLKPARFKSVDSIKKGYFRVPALKKLSEEEQARLNGFNETEIELDEDDLPF